MHGIPAFLGVAWSYLLRRGLRPCASVRSTVTGQLILEDDPECCVGLRHEGYLLGFLVRLLGLRLGIAFCFDQFLEGTLPGSAFRQQFVAARYQESRSSPCWDSGCLRGSQFLLFPWLCEIVWSE